MERFDFEVFIRNRMVDKFDGQFVPWPVVYSFLSTFGGIRRHEARAIANALCARWPDQFKKNLHGLKVCVIPQIVEVVA